MSPFLFHENLSTNGCWRLWNITITQPCNIRLKNLWTFYVFTLVWLVVFGIESQSASMPRKTNVWFLICFSRKQLSCGSTKQLFERNKYFAFINLFKQKAHKTHFGSTTIYSSSLFCDSDVILGLSSSCEI